MDRMSYLFKGALMGGFYAVTEINCIFILLVISELQLSYIYIEKKA